MDQKSPQAHRPEHAPGAQEQNPWQHFLKSSLDAATGVAGSSDTLGRWPHEWMAQSMQATQAWWAWWLQSFSPTQLNWKMPGLTELQAELDRVSAHPDQAPQGRGAVHGMHASGHEMGNGHQKAQPSARSGRHT